MSDNEIGHLEDAAMKRKERLEALRLKNANNNVDENEKNEKTLLPKPKFRSYNPNDEILKQNALPKAEPESVNEQIKDHLSAAKPEPLINEVDLSILAPRKIDWDLKRNLSKKQEKLEKRTQRAIAEIIRERLKDSTDLVDATKAMESAKTAELYGDDD